MALQIRTIWLTPRGDRPLLVVGPSLGTSAAQLWNGCVAQPGGPGEGHDVLAWDLPGHAGTPVGHGFLVADLADGVLTSVARATGDPCPTFAYAGDSLGGAVGLELLLRAPAQVSAAVLLSTGAQIGEPTAWYDRAAAVRAGGTDVVVDGSRQRWFSHRTRLERPELVDDLLATLREVDDEGYAQACEALARFDVTAELGEITAPVLAVAGEEDVPTPVSSLATIAGGVTHGRLVVLPETAHLPPVEQPGAVAGLLITHLAPRGTPR